MVEGYALHPVRGWEAVSPEGVRCPLKEDSGFKKLWADGYICGVLWEDTTSGNKRYSISASTPREWDDINIKLCRVLAAKERYQCGRGEEYPIRNWGFNDVGMGSPEYADGKYSLLSTEEIVGTLVMAYKD